MHVLIKKSFSDLLTVRKAKTSSQVIAREKLMPRLRAVVFRRLVVLCSTMATVGP